MLHNPLLGFSLFATNLKHTRVSKPQKWSKNIKLISKIPAEQRRDFVAKTFGMPGREQEAH